MENDKRITSNPEARERWIKEHAHLSERDRLSAWIHDSDPKRNLSWLTLHALEQRSRDDELATMWAEPLAYIALSERIDAAIRSQGLWQIA